jgi:hypothetical protein
VLGAGKGELGTELSFFPKYRSGTGEKDSAGTFPLLYPNDAATVYITMDLETSASKRRRSYYRLFLNRAFSLLNSEQCCFLKTSRYKHLDF